MLQQHLPFAVCAAECEVAEERSDDEAHTLQVPEQSEGKTKVIKQQHLPLAVLKPDWIKCCARTSFRVATTPIVYGMRRRGRGSRGARRR